MTDPVIVVPTTPDVVVVRSAAPRVVSVGPTTPGPAGPQGPQGPQGFGIPEGGSEGDVIEKTGAGDYQIGWASRPGFLVINPEEAVPEETPAGTIVFVRRVI